ncbi:MAG: FAD/NAD(P)-binding protein [Holophagaceae bacterium]
MTTLTPTPRIVIVGAGCSGTLLAAQLLRQARSPMEVVLLERNPQGFGRGVAYGTTVRSHLLNVPAARMGAYSDQPGGFLAWAEARKEHLLDAPRVPAVGPEDFLPRRAFGAYLLEVLAQAERTAVPGARLVRRIGEAASLSRAGAGWRVDLLDGEGLLADRVVLALGNFPPGDPDLPDAGFLRSPAYHGNPWAPGALETVARTSNCLLIGSGLTMVDWALGLSDLGYEGRIWSLSRRGLRVHEHRTASPPPGLPAPEAAPRTARGWLRWIRAASRGPGGWRGAVDALRSATPSIWAGLGVDEQRRFLRHLRAYWDAHRHRMPPAVAARLASMRAEGQLLGRAGRLRACHEIPGGLRVEFTPRGTNDPESLEVGAVVNCMGSESDYRRLDSRLVRSLLGAGLVRTDVHRLGLEATEEGQLLGRDGTKEELFTLGPPRKGQAWETTAVPEIRVQAEALATRLLRP